VSEQSIGITTGTDLNLHGDLRSIGGTNRVGQFFLPGWQTYATYSVLASNISVATSAAHVLQIMGDGTNYTRLLRYRITPTDDIPASASVLHFQLWRLSTAGTGGSSVTARPFDAADSAYGGGAMTLPTAKGTEGVQLWAHRIPVPSALPLVSGIEWAASERGKPIIFGTGTGNGVAFKIVTGVSSCTVDIECEIVVSSYL
jgi:hypothetical protein